MRLIVAAVIGMAVVLPAGGQAAEYVVKMKFNEDLGKVFFEPMRLEIKLGDRVTWIQEDTDNPHNVVSYPDGIPKAAKLFQSPMMKRRGEQWSMLFDTPGTYKYHCHPHEAVGMKGVVVVERESRPDEIRTPMTGEHSHGAASGHDAVDDGHQRRRRKGHGGSGHDDGHH